MAEALQGAWVPIAGLLVAVMLFWSWQKRNHGDLVMIGRGDTTALPSYRRSLPDLGHELARMRRYERALAVLVLRVDNGSTPESGISGNGNGPRPSAATRIPFWHVGTMLRDLLRDSDVATCEYTTGEYVVLLPETNRIQAIQAANRLGKIVFATTDLHVQSGVAEFPSDGLIVEELVRSAIEDCEKQSSVQAA
jgi:GGDEF domain-containing protein